MDPRIDEAKRRLVRAVRALPRDRQPSPGGPEKDWKEKLSPDWLWDHLLLSFATWGSSYGAEGLINNAENRSQVEYEKLLAMPFEKRRNHIEPVLRRAKVRYPEKKALYLARNVDWIAERGGPARIGEEILGMEGLKPKTRYLEQLSGIGQKYSRNILRDINDPDATHSIALDSRFKNVTRTLGLSFSTYEEEERFYLDVADELGVLGSMLDYSIYENYKEIIDKL
ncbi:MAG: hypothetical protein JW958_00170 [Candidatus Eisenbacteria bacterium]|nr:hypothetical protein [Candidatus Eisenbacteria bacterium]